MIYLPIFFRLLYIIDTKIARFTATNADQADASSELELETIAQPYTNHNGGKLQFGPDGYLYIAMGDGGNGGDPQNFAQNKASLLGKMLRFDVSGGGWAAAGSTLAIGAGFNETVWAYGLRNPWRFSFDKNTGDMFIADVGQNAFEEVNFQLANSTGGENYGWRFCEGLSGYNPSSTDCSASSTSTLLPAYAPPVSMWIGIVVLCLAMFVVIFLLPLFFLIISLIQLHRYLIMRNPQEILAGPSLEDTFTEDWTTKLPSAASTSTQTILVGGSLALFQQVVMVGTGGVSLEPLYLFQPRVARRRLAKIAMASFMSAFLMVRFLASKAQPRLQNLPR